MKLGWKLSIAAAAALLAATSSTAFAQPRGGPGEPGRRPPQEALDACARLKAGDACSFTMNGRAVTGTCRGPADKPAACAPDDLPPPPEGHRGPPQEALDACKGLRDGDTCSFSVDEHDVKGSCRACPRDGTLACAPADLPRGRGMGAHRGPPQEAVAACSGLAAGAACSFTFDGRALDGTCRGPADKPAACAPDGMPLHGEHPAPPAAALDACKGLRNDDTCSFSIDGHDVKGSCRTGPDGGSAACLPEGMSPPPDRR